MLYYNIIYVIMLSPVKAVAELDAAMAEATELRTKEKARSGHTPNLPTKSIPTKICWLTLFAKLPRDRTIPPFNIN